MKQSVCFVMYGVVSHFRIKSESQLHSQRQNSVIIMTTLEMWTSYKTQDVLVCINFRGTIVESSFNQDSLVALCHCMFVPSKDRTTLVDVIRQVLCDY